MKEIKRPIIGYRAPFDLFEGRIKKGQMVTKRPSDIRYGVKLEEGSFTIPKEIVETWEPVYEQKFEVGEYVTCIPDFSPHFGDRKYAGYGYKEGLTFKIVKVSNDCNESNNSIYFPKNSNGIYGFALTRATQEEIELNTPVEIDGEIARIERIQNRHVVTFGCQSFAKGTIEELIALHKREIGFEISINDTIVTLDILKKILKMFP